MPIRRSLIPMLLFAAVCMLLPANSALTLPAGEVDRFFYSDDTFTDIVGEKYIGCDGYHYSWGDQTPYEHAINQGCQTGGGCDTWQICSGGSNNGSPCEVKYQSCW